jgi:hypothetical protein
MAMPVRFLNSRVCVFLATVFVATTTGFAQSGDVPPFDAPPFDAPRLNAPSTSSLPPAPPPGPGFGGPDSTPASPSSPGLAPPPLESEPPFDAPSAPGSRPPFGPPGPPPIGPMYPEPRTYVPPVYVPPPGPVPLIIPAEPMGPTHFWIRSEYLAWWTKDAPLPTPLYTTGSASDPIPGALGQPNTQVLYGGQNVDMGAANGWRLDVGGWIDHEQRFGLQAIFFILERQEADFGAFSDGNGNPLLGRPVNIAGGGGPSSYLDSSPGALAGGMASTNLSQFFGYELNGLFKIFQTDHFRLDGILGFRYLNLRESLELDDQIQPLAPGALTFLGQPVDTSSTMFDFDRFETTNNFYGGQVGSQLEWNWGRWSVDLVTKLAMGTTQEKAIISGGTTVYPANGPGTSATGGVLATTANIG